MQVSPANFDKSTYKALLLDFDGTLVGKNRQVSLELVDVFRKLQKRGLAISIATGKMFHRIDIRRACAVLDLSAPQIVRAGAEIINPKTEEVLWFEYLNPETTKAIIAFLSKESIQFLVEHGCYFYTAAWKTASPSVEEKHIYKPLTELPVLVVPKIIISPILEEAQSLALKKKIQAFFHDIHIVQFYIRDGYGLDITSEKASKHLAVLEYSKIVGIHPDEMIGVGDGHNDYPLLTACGFKVAMGQAPQELKDIADYIAPPQSENGLLTFIEEFLL